MIEAKNLSVTLAGKPILRDVSVLIAPGEMVAVLGPNGSGKSTLVRALAGLIKPAAGEVLLDDHPIRTLAPRRVARTLGVVAQAGGVVPSRSVEQHVALGRHPHRARFAFLGADDRRDRDAIEEAMRRCDVAHLRSRTMETLSGGERQRVRIATALAQEPRALLLDEPLAGLDVEHQLELLKLLADLNGDRALTIGVVLHDMDLAVRVFGRVVVLCAGVVVADGPPREVLDAACFESAFRVDACLSQDRLRRQDVVVCARLADRHARQAAPAVLAITSRARPDPAMPVPR